MGLSSPDKYKNVTFRMLVRLYCRKYILEGRKKAEAWAREKINPEYFPILKPLIIDALKKRGIKV
jgi:hypothetical protein